MASPNLANLTKLPLFQPEQQGLINQATQRASSLLQNQPNFDAYEKLARQNYQTKTVPLLAERFLGSGNNLNSGAFRGALGASAANLENMLAASRAGYDQNQLQNLLQVALQPQFQGVYEPPRPGFFESALPGLAQGAGQALPSLLGGQGGLGSLLKGVAGAAPALGALGPIGAGVGGLAGLAALIHYLWNKK